MKKLAIVTGVALAALLALGTLYPAADAVAQGAKVKATYTDVTTFEVVDPDDEVDFVIRLFMSLVVKSNNSGGDVSDPFNEMIGKCELIERIFFEGGGASVMDGQCVFTNDQVAPLENTITVEVIGLERDWQFGEGMGIARIVDRTGDFSDIPLVDLTITRRLLSLDSLGSVGGGATGIDEYPGIGSIFGQLVLLDEDGD